MESFWGRVEDLFHAALDRPESERETWLAAQTGRDTSARDEVLSLLRADRKHSELCVQSPGADDGGDKPPEADQRFGPYVTERLLGTGGMGAVYLARRADGQFDQTVALKVMAPHLAGEVFVRSFRNERQLLAALAHPNIARLLDGGVVAGGSPYLVMEYVDGELWDRYCATHKLPIEARIRLFLQVCDAVEFAHQNLIVHGDLKPGNILVTADGTVKLLDFGTAKLVRDPEGKVTQFSSLTPRYASPEQLRGERVNTLSDAFSLGVILYESLTGAWPFGDPKSTGDAVDRLLHGRPPDAPAHAITEAAAGERSLSRDRLRRQVAGDLSTIVLKMLESEPAKRYGSVREVKQDLVRFTQGRPVLARPHSGWYTARRFAARNWPAVLASMLAIVALASLTVVSLYQSAQARAQAARAQRVSEFAKDTFLSAAAYWYSPLRGKHDAIQFSDILDNACARLSPALGSDPEAEADLRSTLGFTYALVGEPAKGEAQLLQGIRLIPRIRGGAPKLAGNLYVNLCDARSFQGHYAEALSACRQAAEIDRAADRNSLGGILHDTAYMAVNAGEPLAEAEAMYREAMLYPRANQPSFAPISFSRIGMLHLRQGDLEGGEHLLREAEPPLRGNGEPLIELVPVLYARAFEEDVRGDYPQAVALMSEALDLVTRRRAAFMEPDERALQLAAYEALAGQGNALARLRDVEQRIVYTNIAPVDQIRHHLFAGIVEARCGSKISAEAHLRAALAVQQSAMSRQPDLAVEIYVRLMELLRASGRAKEAAEAAHQGLAVAAQAYGDYFSGHPFVQALANGASR
jgi:serine/threonine protein kinase/tetratricopeptide (TPR) repeat protein